jgi:cytochrome c-type biogenesis protein CcmE
MMSKKAKTIIGVVIIVVVISAIIPTFIQNKIEYVNFNEAKTKTRTVEVQGVWMKNRESKFENNKFTFFMKDKDSTEMKVVFDGAKPNNFEVAEGVVVKGKVRDGVFEANEILTKCPSKYEAKEKGNK